jgi:hypothetical protein
MDTLMHEPDCVCKACCDARLAGKRRKKPKKKSGLLAGLTRMAENANRRQADALDKRADRQEDRAGKMARKHMRGGRRARKAMIAAESDRRKAERLRGQ